MTNLEKLLNRSKHLRTKATPGPFDCHDMGPTLIGVPGKKDILVHGWATAEFIVYSCNTSDVKDEIIKVMAEALKRHTCCLSCEPCTGCEVHDVFKEVEHLAGRCL